jgi:large subunit ribosomal protein L3
LGIAKRYELIYIYQFCVNLCKIVMCYSLRSNTMAGLIGKKLGMTQLYDKEELIPVTVVQAGPCPIVDIRTLEKNGYTAIQIGFDELPARKANKPMTGHFAKAEVAPQRFLREFRLDEVGEFEVGAALDVSQFEVGDSLIVTGKSKGKGFAGVMKRYHFRGKSKTHGTPDVGRRPGSIGQGTTPGKVWKGKKMPGQMGNKICTTKGLTVMRVDPERNLLFLKGAVPGGANGMIILRKG